MISYKVSPIYRWKGLQDIPTPKYAGWEAFFRISGLSESHPWKAKTTDVLAGIRLYSWGSEHYAYQPMYLFLVNIAAIGKVLPKVLLKSEGVSFTEGSW